MVFREFRLLLHLFWVLEVCGGDRKIAPFLLHCPICVCRVCGSASFLPMWQPILSTSLTESRVTKEIIPWVHLRNFLDQDNRGRKSHLRSVWYDFLNWRKRQKQAERQHLLLSASWSILVRCFKPWHYDFPVIMDHIIRLWASNFLHLLLSGSFNLSTPGKVTKVPVMASFCLSFLCLN